MITKKYHLEFFSDNIYMYMYNIKFIVTLYINIHVFARNSVYLLHKKVEASQTSLL